MRRREDQGAAGAEGVGCKNPILDLKMATLGAFGPGHYFFKVQLFGLKFKRKKTVLLGSCILRPR